MDFRQAATCVCLVCAGIGGTSVCERCREAIFRMSAADDLPTHTRYYEDQIVVAWNTTTPTSGGPTQVIRPVGIRSEEAFGRPTVTVGPRSI